KRSPATCAVSAQSETFVSPSAMLLVERKRGAGDASGSRTAESRLEQKRDDRIAGGPDFWLFVDAEIWLRPGARSRSWCRCSAGRDIASCGHGFSHHLLLARWSDCCLLATPALPRRQLPPIAAPGTTQE